MTQVLGKNLSGVLAAYGATQRQRLPRETYDLVQYDLADGRTATLKDIKSGTELTYLSVRDPENRVHEQVVFKDGWSTDHETVLMRPQAEAIAENAPSIRSVVVERDWNHDGKPEHITTTDYESWKQVRVRTQRDPDGDGRFDVFEETKPLKIFVSVNGKPVP